jgi:hypothetical protein
MCANRRLCPDESLLNNTFQCVECNKIIAYLKLDKEKSILSNEHLCTNGNDNANFAELLERLYLSRDNSTQFDHQLELKTKSSILFSGPVPESFRIENVRLPANMIYFEKSFSLEFLGVSFIVLSFLILFLVFLFVIYQTIRFKISKFIFLLLTFLISFHYLFEK